MPIRGIFAGVWGNLLSFGGGHSAGTPWQIVALIYPVSHARTPIAK
jgi:hypothetical protein